MDVEAGAVPLAARVFAVAALAVAVSDSGALALVGRPGLKNHRPKPMPVKPTAVSSKGSQGTPEYDVCPEASSSVWISVSRLASGISSVKFAMDLPAV